MMEAGHAQPLRLTMQKDRNRHDDDNCECCLHTVSLPRHSAAKFIKRVVKNKAEPFLNGSEIDEPPLSDRHPGKNFWGSLLGNAAGPDSEKQIRDSDQETDERPEWDRYSGQISNCVEYHDRRDSDET